MIEDKFYFWNLSLFLSKKKIKIKQITYKAIDGQHNRRCFKNWHHQKTGVSLEILGNANILHEILVPFLALFIVSQRHDLAWIVQ